MADDSTDSSLVVNEGSLPRPDFLSGVTNALGALAGLTAVSAALGEIFNTPVAPADFIVPDLANNGSSALGSLFTSGGMFGSSSMVNRVNPGADSSLSAPSGTWAALDFVINKSLNGMDWKTKNTDPGNPNILEAYRFAGRGFTQDGGTGQYSWAAAYVTWVLVKSGFFGLRTMAPSAFSKYGNTVDFRAGPLNRARKWDIVVFTSNVNIQHVGFIKSYNPNTKILEIVGGDQAETVKVTQMPYSPTDQRFRTIHVRRNWTIPASEDYPLWQRPAPLSGVRLSPVAATYLDSAGNDTGIPVVTDILSTDTLIYNAGQAINSAEAVEAASPAPRPTSNAVVANNGTGDFYDGIRQVSLFESSRGPHDPQKKLELKKRVIAEYNHLTSPRRIGPR